MYALVCIFWNYVFTKIIWKILPSSPGLLPFFIQKCTALGEASTLHCNDTFEPSLVITNWSWTLINGWTRIEKFKY